MRISDWSSDVCSSDLVIGNGGEPLPRKADARPVSQMPTVRQTHRQYGVAGLGECGVHREIRSGPRMRLDVDVLGAEQRLCPIDRQILGYVDVLAPAVVTPPRIALGVLVAPGPTPRSQSGRAGEDIAPAGCKSLPPT